MVSVAVIKAVDDPKVFFERDDWNSAIDAIVARGNIETERKWVVDNVMCSCFTEIKMQSAFTTISGGRLEVEMLCLGVASSDAAECSFDHSGNHIIQKATVAVKGSRKRKN